MKAKTIFTIMLIAVCLLACFGIYRLFFGDVTDRLFTAIRENNVHEAERLIDKGAKVNAVRGLERRRTPLQTAIEKG